MTEDLILRFLTDRDPDTGEKRSKRDGGALVLDKLARTGADHNVVRKLVMITADWSAFHLAQDEYKARGVVQKARELRGILAEADARECARPRYAARLRNTGAVVNSAEMLSQQSALLLAQFDQAAASSDPQNRGYFLEDLLNRTFDLHKIPVLRSFPSLNGVDLLTAFVAPERNPLGHLKRRLRANYQPIK